MHKAILYFGEKEGNITMDSVEFPTLIEFTMSLQKKMSEKKIVNIQRPDCFLVIDFGKVVYFITKEE